MDRKLFRQWWFYVIAAVIVVPATFAAILLFPTSTTPAFLQSVNGAVEVDQGNGFVPGLVGMPLDEDAIIRTADGSAIVVLYERMIVRLEPQTEITVTDLSKGRQAVRQDRGSVWTRVARLAGAEDYSIATPTTTATVRGTSLRTRSDGSYELLVADGNVTAAGLECEDACDYLVGARQKLVYNSMSGTYSYQNLTEEDLAAIREQLDIELRVLRELRLNHVLSNDLAMSIARSTYGASDEDVAQYLIDIDEGRRDDAEIRARAPDTQDLERFIAYNAAIKRTLEVKAAYEG